MSYSDPAPFAQLLLIADSIKSSVETLQAHPDGKEAFEAWVDFIDFNDRYNTRYKDLPVDANVPEAMILVQDSFGTLLDLDKPPILYVESGYSTFLWIKGEWVNEDDQDEEDSE